MEIENIKKLQSDNPDLKLRNIKSKNNTTTLIYFDTLCDLNTINEMILKPINDYDIKTIEDLKDKIPHANIKEITDEDTLLDSLYNGFSIIMINNEFISCETKSTLDSGIAEASNEKVIKGPKDAFTENYQTNIGLIRKRIKSKDLKINEHVIGTSSKTKVSLIYMDNIVNKDLANKIEKKLKTMSMDYVANSNYIFENLSENNSMMPTNIMTERPDKVSYGLMEGKLAIIVENSPQVIILPAFFDDFIKTPDDYYQNTKNVSATRIIRFIALIISIFTPALYIALTTFNQETLPTSVLINFSMQREGVPFPSVVEAVVMWLTFEILRESDTRIPFVMGTSMSIVGALVLGQAAVEAGMISPIMIIVIAISSVSSLLFNDNDMVNAIRIWKLIFLLFGAFVGLYGVFMATLIFIIKLCSTESYGFDYTLPNAPFSLNLQKNNLILTKKFKLNQRNPFITNNIHRR